MLCLKEKLKSIYCSHCKYCCKVAWFKTKIKQKDKSVFRIVSQSPGELVKTQISGYYSQNFWFSTSEFLFLAISEVMLVRVPHFWELLVWCTILGDNNVLDKCGGWGGEKKQIDWECSWMIKQ